MDAMYKMANQYKSVLVRIAKSFDADSQEQLFHLATNSRTKIANSKIKEVTPISQCV